MDTDDSSTERPSDAADSLGGADGNAQHTGPRTELSIDMREAHSIPRWVEEVIASNLAIEQEDARSAGALGFMHRALVNTAMPYKDPKTRVFERKNGSFTLSILAGYSGGIPYGIYPRLLMSWVSTEVVKTRSPELELGESLAGFLRTVLSLSSTGGKFGTSTRVTEQMKRLFGSQIVAYDAGERGRRPFSLRNMAVAKSIELDEVAFERRLAVPSEIDAVDEGGIQLWTPQDPDNSGGWQSKLVLTEYFFEEILRSPVPIDLRAYRALRGSPLAMDVYSWLTYRMSYLQRPTRTIKWEVLMAQFGSNYTGERAINDFKRNFIKALHVVNLVYPKARVKVEDDGVILYPSPPHIPQANDGSQYKLPGF